MFVGVCFCCSFVYVSEYRDGILWKNLLISSEAIYLLNNIEQPGVSTV